MNKSALTVAILLSIPFSFSVFSQNPDHNINHMLELQTKPPGLTDFVKYGNLSNISYTGELKVDIPLISAPIPNNNPINVSLSYVGSGFKPAKRNGLVGQNWFLNAGGVITREVNGMPDDQRGAPHSYSNDPNYTNGFIVGVENRQYNAEDVFNWSSITGYKDSQYVQYYLFGNPNVNNFSQNDVNNYEANPDIFTFNFNGISGKFFMGNDGNVKVATNTPNKLTVDLSGLAFQPDNTDSCIPSGPSEITIKDDNGNIYFFGGETKNLEYSLSIPIDSEGNAAGSSDERPIIDAWYLSKIEYYNGYVVHFVYRDDSELDDYFANEESFVHGNYYEEYTPGTINKKDFLQFSEFYSRQSIITGWTGSIPGTGGVSGQTTYNLSYSVRKIAILESIIADDFEINLQYSRQEQKFNTRNGNVQNDIPRNTSFFELDYNDGFKDIKLDNITYNSKSNGIAFNLINSINFKYDYLGGEHSRMFLSSMNQNGIPPYKFEYYATGNLPKPITKGTDHWGFWNGRNDNSNQITPSVNLDIYGDFSYSGANSNSRDPIFSFAVKGQLYKMVYPAGGYSTFEYEPHNYYKRLETRFEHDFVPKLYNESGVAGGTRIMKIIDHESDQPILEKEYKYLNNFNGAEGIDSGILLKWPRYALAFRNSDTTFGYIRSTPIGKNLAESIHMSYSEVVEVINGNGDEGNGYTVTKFRDFITNPDDQNYDWTTIRFGLAQGVTPLGLAQNYAGYFLNDRSIERGKPLWTKIKDESNNLVEETVYEYNENPFRLNQFSTQIHISSFYAQANKLYYYSDFLTKSTNNKYLDNGIFTTINTNAYDSDTKKIIRSSIISSNNDEVATINNYAFNSDYHLVLLSDSQSFHNDQLIASKEILYGDQTDLQTNFKYYPKEIINYKHNGQSEDSASKIIIHKYDSKGNPLEVSKADGSHICYIWGYNESLLIAKIENITYNQLNSSIIDNLQNLSNIDRDGGNPHINASSTREDNLRQALNDLRSVPSLSESMITTYTYNPLIGVTTITDPRGNTIYYYYDNSERLVLVKDRDGNKLSKNEYNYQSEN